MVFAKNLVQWQVLLLTRCGAASTRTIMSMYLKAFSIAHEAAKSATVIELLLPFAANVYISISRFKFQSMNKSGSGKNKGEHQPTQHRTIINPLLPANAQPFSDCEAQTQKRNGDSDTDCDLLKELCNAHRDYPVVAISTATYHTSTIITILRPLELGPLHLDRRCKKQMHLLTCSKCNLKHSAS